MKLTHYLLAGWTLVACLNSCKKPIEPVIPDPIEKPGPTPTPENPVVDPAGLVCPPGEPTGGDEINRTVGPAGGTVALEDGSVRIEIPAGALSRQENIRIEPITNTNPTGKGTAYRLEPHGTTFAKPVKLTVAYSEDELSATVAEALQMAYQADNGVWMAMPGIQLNKQAKTITIETTHFSDWSYFSSVYLSPQQRGIRPGESVSMKVYTTLVVDEDEILLAPLDKEQAVTEAQLLVKLGADQSVPVIQWAISEGIGKLATTGAGSMNTYTAPTSLVKPTPVTVTARVRSAGNHFLLLVSSMMIMPAGIIYRLDGGPWVHRPGTAQRTGGQVLTIGAAKPSSGDTGLALTLNLPQFGSTKPVSLGWGPTALLSASPVSGFLHYECYYGINAKFSPGSLILSDVSYSPHMPGVEYASVNGSFTVAKAGAYGASGYQGAHRIEGFFCIGKAE